MNDNPTPSTALLIGGQPRHGKSAALRRLLIATLLSPTPEPDSAAVVKESRQS